MLTGDHPGSALRLPGGPFQAQREPFSLPPRLLEPGTIGGTMFNIVLVHPEIPPNTGNVIRLSLIHI